MKIKKFAGNNKGATLILVIVVLMVVTILADILIETAFQNYKLGKASGYTDYSYYAAENAIQKCFDFLNQKSKDTGLITYNGSADEFANNIFNLVFLPYVNKLSSGGNFKNLDIKDDTSHTADVDMKLEYLGWSPVEAGKIKIKVGLSARSEYTVKPFLSGGKTAYATKEFTVTIPDAFQLRGPVYTIGDLMADRKAKVDIVGDVHVYGTSPEYLKQPEQYYYGGIYAQADSEMRIKGNAYSRSFIRTGQYSGTPDASSIYVYKDAVAQCLQIFGRGEKIAVLRNAYTFDDMEVNGEDSVLAVNGNYFGLSDGSDGSFHDNSSAIVNSAPIHYMNSDESQKSRIVINGAVMANGGTFRIDEKGDALYQIEDASVAWYNDPLSPVYKSASDVKGYDYIQWLIGEYSPSQKNMGGFGNLFQVFKPWEKTSETPDNYFSIWLHQIDLAREPGSHNNTSAYTADVIPDKIKGFSNYVLAANDGMYFMKKNDVNGSAISRATMLIDNVNPFTIDDNIKIPDGFGSWNVLWNYYINNDKWNSVYCTGIPDALNNKLKPSFLHEANIFVGRDTTGTIMNGEDTVKSGKAAVVHKSLEVFAKIWQSLHTLVTSTTNPYIIDPSIYNGDLSHPDCPYNSISANPWADEKNFLVVNENPNLDLVLNGTTFNGIIFTTGKVILKNGAQVNGAIVAAGKGFDKNAATAGYIGGTAAETTTEGGIKVMPRVPRIIVDPNDPQKPLNLKALDNGDYAAVYCTNENDVNGKIEAIHFPGPVDKPLEGRDILLNKFLLQDENYPLDLFNIF